MGEPKPAFLRRVKLRNYKSIRECDVSLGRLTFLVGPNGSGKSNFLDALRFVCDSLRTTMQHAVEERGEVRQIFWRDGEEDAGQFSIQLWLDLPQGGDASYRTTVGDEEGLFVIEEEHCLVDAQGAPRAEFLVRKGKVAEATIPTPPSISEGQLYLTSVSGYPEFSPVYQLLKGMRFYNIDPQQIRKEALSGIPARELLRTGKGALFATSRAFRNEQVKARIEEYLRAILPTLSEVVTETYWMNIVTREGVPIKTTDGSNLVTDSPRSLSFVLRTNGSALPFGPQNLSDGTLRAFGVLLALFQCVDRPKDDPIPLVGIEEPESTLHPAAAGVLFDALHEASHFTQVLVTTHSPDLLDIKDLDVDSLLIVDMADGQTVIGPADEVSRSIMRDRLSTAGELLRQNQLRPESQSPGPVGVDTD